MFQDRRQYRVPFYQRPYVWNKEDQWERLWGDIQDKAEARLLGNRPVPHFLGAVVLEPQPRQGLLGVEALHIIDGQQRLTTLQYLLAALAMVLRSHAMKPLLSLVDGCLVNPNPETMEDAEIEVFKVWPTFRDRIQYQDAMAAAAPDELRQRFPSSFTQAGSLRKVGIDHPPALEAIWYFHEQLSEWAGQAAPEEVIDRLNALTEAVLRDLNIVSISLGEEDDAQVIFETLNGHGAELHATDLIRNFVFMRADRERVDAGELYDTLWSPFESGFWIEEQRRGRLKKPRIEWFVQTALQTEIGDEVDVGRLYVAYRRFATGGPQPVPATEQLRRLNGHSENYRWLVSGQGNSPIGRFGRRVQAWDASTTHSLALLIAKSGCSPDEQRHMFDDLVSYLVRRAICGLTAKNYNKVFVLQLKKVATTGLNADTLRGSLAGLEGDASRWPRDNEFRKAWLEAAIYPGRLDAARTKAVLAELETAMRSERSEEPIPAGLENLDVDHIMPTSWFEYWPLSDGSNAQESEVQGALMASFGESPLSTRHAAILRREIGKVRIGNLTLLHYGVNRGLQNREFSKKRDALFAESNLHLNRSLMVAQAWGEESIDTRGRELFEIAKRVWRGPED
jgi:hypothetical protein